MNHFTVASAEGLNVKVVVFYYNISVVFTLRFNWFTAMMHCGVFHSHINAFISQNILETHCVHWTVKYCWFPLATCLQSQRSFEFIAEMVERETHQSCSGGERESELMMSVNFRRLSQLSCRFNCTWNGRDNPNRHAILHRVAFAAVYSGLMENNTGI